MKKMKVRKRVIAAALAVCMLPFGTGAYPTVYAADAENVAVTAEAETLEQDTVTQNASSTDADVEKKLSDLVEMEGYIDVDMASMGTVTLENQMFSNEKYQWKDWFGNTYYTQGTLYRVKLKARQGMRVVSEDVKGIKKYDNVDEPRFYYGDEYNNTDQDKYVFVWCVKPENYTKVDFSIAFEEAKKITDFLDKSEDLPLDKKIGLSETDNNYVTDIAIDDVTIAGTSFAEGWLYKNTSKDAVYTLRSDKESDVCVFDKEG